MKYQAFFEFMSEYTVFFEAVVVQEKTERAALLANDIGQVEQSLARQQAVIKQIENMEHRRVDIQEESGLAELTFREILSRMVIEEREVFSPLIERMEKAVTEVKYLNGKSREIAQVNLNAIARLYPEATRLSVGGYFASPAQGVVREPVTPSAFEAKI